MVNTASKTILEPLGLTIHVDTDAGNMVYGYLFILLLL